VYTLLPSPSDSSCSDGRNSDRKILRPEGVRCGNAWAVFRGCCVTFVMSKRFGAHGFPFHVASRASCLLLTCAKICAKDMGGSEDV